MRQVGHWCVLLILFQVLADSETAELGFLILGLQVAVAIGVTIFVVKRARAELDRTINSDQSNAAKDANKVLLEVAIVKH